MWEISSLHRKCLFTRRVPFSQTDKASHLSAGSPVLIWTQILFLYDISSYLERVLLKSTVCKVTNIWATWLYSQGPNMMTGNAPALWWTSGTCWCKHYELFLNIYINPPQRTYIWSVHTALQEYMCKSCDCTCYFKPERT